jgi:hypothetical protein
MTMPSVRLLRDVPLGQRYDPHIPRQWLARMEEYAEELGIAASTVEALGRDSSLCEAFIEARDGDFDDLARAIAASARRIDA